MGSMPQTGAGAGAFHHEAMFYSGEGEYLAGTVPFLREGLSSEEPMLVAVSAAKRRLIEGELGADATAITFVDMERLGRNPARIIPAWSDFVTANCSERRAVRGIGEPIWPGRTGAEVVECQSHESLLNLAFDGGPPWSLLCPYDADGLDEDVLEAARRTHPHISRRGERHASGAYLEPLGGPGPFDPPLPPPAVAPEEVVFDAGGMGRVRSLVSGHAAAAGLGPERTADLELAATELATNSIRHGGGEGTIRVWREGDTLICEVSDEGRIDAPLVGRQRPQPQATTGRGLWVVNLVCDLVQIRSRPAGNVVRLHMALA
jgi:anti-sigma regulatory factor (Ser/Thr protein kinase)